MKRVEIECRQHILSVLSGDFGGGYKFLDSYIEKAHAATYSRYRLRKTIKSLKDDNLVEINNYLRDEESTMLTSPGFFLTRLGEHTKMDEDIADFSYYSENAKRSRLLKRRGWYPESENQI